MIAAATAAKRLPLRGAAKRQAILEAATELFLTIGYGAASINRVVEKIGGSKSTVYAHFENKQKLFECVVASVVGEVVEELRDLETEGLSFRHGLTLIARRLFELVQSPRHIGLARMVMAEANRFPEIGRIYYRHGPAQAYAELEAFIRGHAKRGGMEPDKVAKATEFFAGMLLHRWTFKRLCIEPAPPTTRQTTAHVKSVVDHFMAAYGSGEV